MTTPVFISKWRGEIPQDSISEEERSIVGQRILSEEKPGSSKDNSHILYFQAKWTQQVIEMCVCVRHHGFESEGHWMSYIRRGKG